MTDHVKALETAYWYYDLGRREQKFDKQEAVKELAAFGLFTPIELSRILGVSVDYAQKHMGTQTNTSWPTRVWSIDALHVLWLIAIDYWNANEVAKTLVQLASDNNCSIKAIAQLTGVPLDQIREAVYDDPNLLGLLRAGADTPSD